MAESKTILHYNVLSQPTRACRALLDIGKVPHELNHINFMTGDHKAPEFLKKHRLGALPVLEEGDFFLAESTAILRYIHAKNNLSEDLYPADLKKRANVDKWMSWCDYSFRSCILTSMMPRWLFLMAKVPHPPKEFFLENLKRQLLQINFLEEELGDNGDFVCGDKMTMADIKIYFELTSFTDY